MRPQSPLSNLCKLTSCPGWSYFMFGLHLYEGFSCIISQSTAHVVEPSKRHTPSPNFTAKPMISLRFRHTWFVGGGRSRHTSPIAKIGATVTVCRMSVSSRVSKVSHGGGIWWYRVGAFVGGRHFGTSCDWKNMASELLPAEIKFCLGAVCISAVDDRKSSSP